MKALQTFLIVMGVLAVLAIIVLIVGYVLALLTPDIRSNIRPVVLSSEAVDSLNSKIDAFENEATSAISDKAQKNIELVVTEEEINSLIVMNLAEGALPAREMLVNFNDGYLLTYNAWSFTGFPVKTGIMGSIDIEDGKLKFLVRDFYLGKLPNSNTLNNRVQELINIWVTLNIPVQELKLDWKEVTISEGQIRLLASTKK